MVSNLPIPPHAEVFNTYGERLTNAQLLARYGFVLEGNDNDTITFAPEDIRELRSSFSAAEDAFVGMVRDALQRWPRYAGWSKSNLVYQPYQDATATARTVSPESVVERGVDGGPAGKTAPLHMCMNSDAKISHTFWVCAALLALDMTPTPGTEQGGERTVATLRRLAVRQLYWEAQVDSQDADADDDEGADESPDKQASVSTHSADDTVRARSYVLLRQLRDRRRPCSSARSLARCHRAARRLPYVGTVRVHTGSRPCVAVARCDSSLEGKGFFRLPRRRRSHRNVVLMRVSPFVAGIARARRRRVLDVHAVAARAAARPPAAWVWSRGAGH